MRSGMELAQEIQLTDWSTAGEQGKLVFYGFDHAITGAIYFTFHNGKNSSLDRPNYTSIQVFHFIKGFLSRKNVEKKFVLRSKKIFATSIQFVACALRGNLSNRSSGVQIPHDICTCFGHCSYSTKCSWIINLFYSSIFFSLVAFRIYDMDNDGFISNGELFQVLKMMVGNNLKETQLQQIVDKTVINADKDGDGKISFSEFCAVSSIEALFSFYFQH